MWNSATCIWVITIGKTFVLAQFKSFLNSEHVTCPKKIFNFSVIFTLFVHMLIS